MATMRTINVVEFAEARANEIQSMEKALKYTSENAGMQRVFQKLPRHMRRRAASHNIKRLPQRLRQKALEQINRDPIPAGPKLKSSRRKKRRSGTIAQVFANRNSSKLWLETHVWHAKRMKMCEKWGFKLALHPNEKNIRSIYRASKHECVLYDASYMSCIEITTADVESLANILKMITDTHIWIESSHESLPMTLNTLKRFNLYAPGEFPRELLGPVECLRHTECAMWLWMHPLIQKQVLECINSVLEVNKLKSTGLL